ncbi:MAG: hypothetical protein AAGA66_03235 [Bacteroidota bacterium]
MISILLAATACGEDETDALTVSDPELMMVPVTDDDDERAGPR